MEMKSLLLGIGGTLAFLITIGAGLAAIAGAGQTVTVPAGKTMFYFIADTDQALELRDAICANYNHNPDKHGSCTDYAQEQIKDYLRENVKKYRHEQALAAINTGDELEIN